MRYSATILVPGATGHPVHQGSKSKPLRFDASAILDPPTEIEARLEHRPGAIGVWQDIHIDGAGALRATLYTSDKWIDHLIQDRGRCYASIGARVYAYRDGPDQYEVRRAELKEISIVKVPGFPGTQLTRIEEE